MDTSGTFIKMRIKAIPDLGNGKVMVSDFRSENYHAFEGVDYDVWVDSIGNWYVFETSIPPVQGMGRVCQLERQDQLQEMVGLWVNSRFEVMAILKKFYDFSIKDLCSDLTWSLYSMEQLWLAFVMKEKYNKVWDGKDWV